MSVTQDIRGKINALSKIFRWITGNLDWLGLQYSTPLLTIFQLYRGGQFYW
jgi:hypothetical protein